MTGKQRIREILWTMQTKSVIAKPGDPYVEMVDEALDSIEEIVKEVLGEEARFRKSDDDLDRGVEIGYNTLLAEQLGRWESK